LLLEEAIILFKEQLYELPGSDIGTMKRDIARIALFDILEGK
jgi:hypothetical protein